MEREATGRESTTAQGSPEGEQRSGNRAVLRVLSLADQGMALARLDGKAVFLPFAAPGDLVEVEITRERKRHAEARLLRVLEPSPTRREPACPHFGECGGCQWQHVPYGEQLAAKADAFRGFLSSRLGLGGAAFRPALPSDREWGYRNRAGLKVRRRPDGVEVGYFGKGTHRIVPVRACPIAHERIQAFLPELRAFLGRFPAAEAVPQVDLQVDGAGGLWAVFHGLRPFSSREAGALRAFAVEAGLAGAHVQAGRKHTLSPLTPCAPRMPFFVEAGGRRLELGVSPGGFAQANAGVNDRLVAEAAALAPLYDGAPALDVFCGAGNFTLPLALRASDVAGVEGYPPAAADAAHNAKANGLANVRILSAPAEEGLARLLAEGYRPRFALIDPPREGAAGAVGLLADLAPEHVLYVSCAPPTLVRDLGVLQGRGYRVEWTRTADMFPQTAHTESLTLLRRTQD